MRLIAAVLTDSQLNHQAKTWGKKNKCVHICHFVCYRVRGMETVESEVIAVGGIMLTSGLAWAACFTVFLCVRGSTVDLCDS